MLRSRPYAAPAELDRFTFCDRLLAAEASKVSRYSDVPQALIACLDNVQVE
jgi:hypothetical protein